MAKSYWYNLSSFLCLFSFIRPRKFGLSSTGFMAYNELIEKFWNLFGPSIFQGRYSFFIQLFWLKRPQLNFFLFYVPLCKSMIYLFVTCNRPTW